MSTNNLLGQHLKDNYCFVEHSLSHHYLCDKLYSKVFFFIAIKDIIQLFVKRIKMKYAFNTGHSQALHDHSFGLIFTVSHAASKSDQDIVFNCGPVPASLIGLMRLAAPVRHKEPSFRLGQHLPSTPSRYISSIMMMAMTDYI